MTSSLALLLSIAISSNGPDHLATVDAHGTIRASLDDGDSWRVVHRCPLDEQESSDSEPDADASCAGYPRRAAVTWLGDTLYLACTGQGLWHWRADMARAHPADAGPVTGIDALAAHGHALVVADTHGVLWHGQPGDGFRSWAQAPDTILDVAWVGRDIIVAGHSAVWRLAEDRTSWQLVASMRVCAVAGSGARSQAELWLAGPDGLASVTGTDPGSGIAPVHWHRMSPLTGVAVARDHVVLADGRGLEVVSMAEFEHDRSRSAHIGDTPLLEVYVPLESTHSRIRDPTTWERLRVRAHIAALLPSLSLGASLAHTPGEHDSIHVWVWLTWTIPAAEVRP